MPQQSSAQTVSRSTRGGTAARVLLIILGVFLASCGFIFTIACIALLFEEDTAGLVVMPFALGGVIGGIALIVTQVRKKDTTSTSSPAAVDAATNGGETIVSVQPLTGGAASAATPRRAATAPASGTSSSAEDVANLVMRSSNLFASLRDLVRHEADFPGGSKYHLASMLKAAGLMEWPDAPACEGGRLSRNHHFWIRLSTDDLTPDQYDLLISAEAALSVNQDLPNVQSCAVDDPAAVSAAQNLMRNIASQQVKESPLTDEGLHICYRDTPANQTPGEWVVRSFMANAAESATTPFRMNFNLRANVEAGLVVMSVEVPRPRCMRIFTSDVAQQAGFARAYALRVATFLARHAFDASEHIERVVINCIEHDKTETLLSIDFNRTLLASLQKAAKGAQIEQGFPTNDAIRFTFEQGWFVPVEPFVAIESPQAVPVEARIYPELDDRAASADIQRTCGAQRISDLGINENAVRIAAWDQLSRDLPESTEKAVQALVALRNSAANITVVEACTRTIQALVDGKIDLDDRDGLAHLFIDGSSLDRAVQRAADLLNREDGQEDPEGAYQILSQALAPIDDMGAYLDDDTTAYRYFGSVCERIIHNLVVDEHGRQVTLVPDSYFNAHSNASIALGMMGRNDEALEHADTCIRLAPTSTYAILRKVRILESQSRIYESADLIKQALRTAATAHDAAVCHYRLAFMEWKLGREDLAAACYVRALAWNTDVTAQAREELDDLVASIDGLDRPTAEQAESLLAREGIPLGCVKTDGERLLAAGVACCDDHAFYTARGLMAALFGMNSDDVVMGVYRSLKIDA